MPAKYKKRPDGRYLIQVVTGYKTDGKPKYKNIYAKTIRELEEKAAKIREELDKGIIVDDERLTLRQWGERWLELYKPNVSYNTRRMYETALNAHIYPSMGAVRLRDIKPHHAQEIINTLTASGKSRMAEQVKLTLTQLFSQAVKNEYVYKNIMNSVEMPKRDKAKKRALTEEEVSYVRNAVLPLREKTFAMLLLSTGLRRGEAFALTVGDVDMKNKSISVNKNAITKNNRMEIKPSPKTAAGNREIPITDELLSYLKEYLPTLTGMCLFPGASGGLMTDTTFRVMWNKILDAMDAAAGGKTVKIKAEKETYPNGMNKPGPRKTETLRIRKLADDITPHIFRHTYATLLYEAGVDVKVSQYLLGHSSMQVTMDIYTDLSENKKESEFGKFNTFMESNIQSKISQNEYQTPENRAN